MGNHCWIVAGMPAEPKQLIRASQIAAHKTPSVPESPLSLCYVTVRERREEWDCACPQNLKTCSFVPCGKLTSACVLKAVMADWNCSNHFDTPCICCLVRLFGFYPSLFIHVKFMLYELKSCSRADGCLITVLKGTVYAI